MSQSDWHLYVHVAVSLVLLWAIYHQFNLAIEADRLRRLFYWTFWFPLALWSGPAFQNQLSSDFHIWLNAFSFLLSP